MQRAAWVSVAVACTVIALFLLLPAPALAWKRNRTPTYPGGRATWYSVSPQWRDEMREVAASINASGARVHLTEARSARTARILIRRPGGRPPCTGYLAYTTSQSSVDFGICKAFGTQPAFVAKRR